MRGYACVQGPRKKVLSISKDRWWARWIAATYLDYEAVCGIAGSIHNVGRVLKAHDVKVVRIDYRLEADHA